MDDDWDDNGGLGGQVQNTDFSAPNDYQDNNKNYDSNSFDRNDNYGGDGGYNSFNSDSRHGDNGDRKRGGFRGGRGGRGGNRDSYRNRDGDNDDVNNRDEDGSYGNRGFNNDRRGGGRGRGRGRGNGDRDFGGKRYDDNNDADNGNGDVDGDGDMKPEKPKEFYVPNEMTEDEIFTSGISSGINFNKYDDIKVNVTGENCPNPIKTFQESGINDYLLNNVKRCNYVKPTPIQRYGLPIIMAERDMMACAQTGSGKTAAFLLPILHNLMMEQPPTEIGQPFVVIISPTRELTIQIYNEARKFASGSVIKVSIVYGGTAVRHQCDTLKGGCHILVATPGRLLDFVEKDFIRFDSVRYVVLDEADRMLDMGFMPAIEKMMGHQTMPEKSKRQTLMFSATFPEEIQVKAGQFLSDYVFVVVGMVGGACSDVQQVILEVGKFEKRKKLEEILRDGDNTGTIVFVETKRNADYLASLLSETMIPTTSIHGDRMQREREEALADFKTGRMHVLVATSVAARGLDIKNVRHVINYDLPKSIDDYVHRIGRTGRVGNCGKATSFYDPEQDSALAGSLVNILKSANQSIPDFLQGHSGSGSGGYRPSKFGGRDIRSDAPAAVSQQDDGEEGW